VTLWEGGRFKEGTCCTREGSSRERLRYCDRLARNMFTFSTASPRIQVSAISIVLMFIGSHKETVYNWDHRCVFLKTILGPSGPLPMLT